MFIYSFIHLRCAGSLLWHVGSFLVAACGFLSCSMRTLSCGMCVGPSSLTRDRTLAPYIGSRESYPLDHEGNPLKLRFLDEIIIVIRISLVFN